MIIILILIEEMVALLSETVIIPETILQRKVIVYKPRLGIKAARKCAEKTKTQLFTKYLFLKSKPEEIKIDTMEKYFEPYIVIDGKYSIDYSKNWNHQIQVDETMQNLKIFNKKIEPESLNNHLELPYKLLELKGTGRFYYEDQGRLIFDKQWNAVGLEQLPYLPFEEEPEETLNEVDHQLGNQELVAEKEVEILRSKILKRPTDILKVHDELFSVTERALIFKPMYKVTASDIKTQKKATFLIDGINGKIISNRKERLNLPTKETFKEMGSKLYNLSKNKAEKFYNFLKKTKNNITIKK